MADVEHLTYGLVNPLFAFGMAVLGNLLGLILATNSLGHTGRARRRLLLYAAIAFGGTGIWVPSLVAMLGFSVPDSVLRYAPQPLAVSFGIAVVGVGAGLAVVCTGRIRALRLLLGGLLIGAAIAGANLALVLSLRVGGTVSLQDNLFATSVGAAMVSAGVIAGFLVGLRRIWVALAAAALLGLAITATHYLTIGAVRVELGVEHTPIEGVTPILLFAVVILFSTTALALLWFFSVGTATRSDLRAVFATPHRPIDIEPWMIEQVTARIAIGTSLTFEDAEDAAPTRRAPAPRPTPGFAPAPRSRPAWATAALASNGAAMAANGRLGRADRTNARTPVPWVSNHPIPVEPAAATLSATMNDDTDVHGLGAALVNAARISGALDHAATERPAPAAALPVRGGTTTDRTPSGLPMRGRAGTGPDPEPATMDSTDAPTAPTAPTVLTEAEPQPDPAPGSDEASDATPTAEATGWRGRWRNRRR